MAKECWLHSVSAWLYGSACFFTAEVEAAEVVVLEEVLVVIEAVIVTVVVVVGAAEDRVSIAAEVTRCSNNQIRYLCRICHLMSPNKTSYNSLVPLA